MNNEITYKLLDDADGFFGINEHTGVVTTERILQDSSPQVLDILVQAESDNGSIVEQRFEIALVEAGLDFGIKPSFGHEKKGFMDKLQSVKLRTSQKALSSAYPSRLLIP